MSNLRHYETDKALDIAVWLSVTLPHVHYGCAAGWFDLSVIGCRAGPGIIVLWPSDDDEMLFRMRWDGHL